MGSLVGAKGQTGQFSLFCMDGAIASGGTAQLVLPVVPSRSLLQVENTSSGNLFFEIGSARASATLSNGVVASCSITNAGFNFTLPPVIRFLGGGLAGNGSFLGLGQPGGAAPTSTLGYGRVAQAHCVMTGSAPNLSVSSIVIDDPGAGYVTAPYVFIFNSELDPYGCAVPSDGVGLAIQSGGSFNFDATSCPTDSISVWGDTDGQTFICRWMQ